MKKNIFILLVLIFFITLFGNSDIVIALPKAKENKSVQTVQQAPQLKSADSGILKNINLSKAKLTTVNEAKTTLNRVNIIPIPPSIQNIQANVVDYYKGIEKAPTKLALFSLIDKQNSDGSFGNIQKITTTWEYIKALEKFNLISNNQYLNALSFLSLSVPQSNREKAIKIQALKRKSQNYDALLTEILNTENEDFGYGFAENYPSEFLATLEVMNMLDDIDYSNVDYINNAASYLLNKVQPDGSIKFPNSQTPSYYLINKALESFYPFKENPVVLGKINSMLGYLANNYNESTGILNNTQSLLDYAMTSYSFKLYGASSSKEQKLKSYLLSKQDSDGLFAENEHLITFTVMKALSQADLRIDSATSIGTLENYATATFNIAFTNIGTAELSQFDLRGFLDNIFSINLEGVYPSDGTKFQPNTGYNISFNYRSTEGCIGSTKLTIYLDFNGDSDYDNNLGAQTFNFAAASDGRSALPLYHTMYKSQHDGTPAAVIKWQYLTKSNPNLNSYYLAYKLPSASVFNYIPLSQAGDIIYGFPEGSFYDLKLCSYSKNNWLSCFNSLTLHLSANPDLYTGSLSGYLTQDNKILPQTKVALDYEFNETTNNDGQFFYSKIGNGRSAISLSSLDHPAFETILSQFIVSEGLQVQNIRVYGILKEDTVPPSIEGIGINTIFQTSSKNNQAVKFTASVNDNRSIKEGDFYLYDPKLDEWKYLGTNPPSRPTVPADLILYFFIDKTYLGNGYKLKITARDYRNNEIIKESGSLTFTDGVPIDPISDFTGSIEKQETSGKNYVKLTWDKTNNPDNDFSHYAVFRSAENNITDLNDLNPHKIIEDINVLQLNDTDQLTETVNYYYAIAAVDINENIENKIFQEIGPFYIYNPLYVELESFSAARVDALANITWITATEIDNNHFNLWRSNEEKGDYERINKENIIARGNIYDHTEYTYQDSGLNSDKDYYYKLEDVDIYGHSDFKGPFKALYPELIITINSFKTVSTSSALSIVWQSEKEQSVKEFNILRANIKRGVYKKINSAPILPKGMSSYKYSDLTVAKSLNYFYKLEVLGKNNGESKLFGPISGKITIQ